MNLVKFIFSRRLKSNFSGRNSKFNYSKVQMVKSKKRTYPVNTPNCDQLALFLRQIIDYIQAENVMHEFVSIVKHDSW